MPGSQDDGGQGRPPAGRQRKPRSRPPTGSSPTLERKPTPPAFVVEPPEAPDKPDTSYDVKPGRPPEVVDPYERKRRRRQAPGRRRPPKPPAPPKTEAKPPPVPPPPAATPEPTPAEPGKPPPQTTGIPGRSIWDENSEAISVSAPPQPAPVIKERAGWMRPTVIAVAVAAVLGLGYAMVGDGDPTADERAAVEQLAESAQVAMRGSFFTYPSPDTPKLPTAYQAVVQLESMEGAAADLAQGQADELRKDAAVMLVRLGNKYWLRNGGRPFAADYYAQALLFDPDNEDARERVALTTGELATLREKAGSGDFSKADLLGAEPLLVLAAYDVEDRAKKLEVMRARGGKRSASTDAHLDQLLDERSGAEPSPDEDTKDTKAPDETKDAKSPEVSPPVPAEPKEPPAKKQPETEASDARPISVSAGGDGRTKARELASEGRKALRAGRRDDAKRLFEKALDHDPKYHRAFIGLSSVYFHAGNYKQAVKLAEKAVRAAPSKAEYRMKLGDAYYKVSRYQDARNQYKKAERFGHKDAAFRLQKVEKKLGG